MTIDLKDCILITSSEYAQFSNAEFIGQTQLDKENQYYMVWKHDGKLYKTHNTL